MDETRNTPALILNRQDYKENDSLVTAYTLCFGKLALVARGTKKLHSKLAGHLEPLTLADIMIINGRGRDYVGAALGRVFYSGVKSDLNKLYYAGRALSLFNRFVKEEQADEQLFFLLSQWLLALDGVPAASDVFPKESGELFFAFFAWKLLAAMGYQPETRVCLSCKRQIIPGKNYFNLRGGGLVCESCYKTLPLVGISSDSGILNNPELLTISDNCVKILRFILDNELKIIGKVKIDKKLMDELLSLTNAFINFCC